MIRWAEIVGLALLALASLGTLTLAGARHAAEKSGAEVLSPSPETSSTGDDKNVRACFPGKLPIRELNEQEAILHALNRLGFGPRPGQVEQIEKTGLENWIQAQLHPENTSDPVVDARLAQFPALSLSAAQLLDEYPPQNVAAKRLGMKVEEYQKHLQDLAKKTGGINSLPFK